MRIVTLAVALTAAIVAVALSCAAADYPPAFPRAGASLVLDNAWGSAWDVSYTPGQPTPMHRHQLDSVGVELADSSVTVTTPDGAQETFPSKHGDAYYMPRGTTHIEVTPLGLCAPACGDHRPEGRRAGGSGDWLAPASFFPDTAASKVAESPRVILWDYAWPSSTPRRVMLAHNAFIVILDGGELRLPGPDGRRRVETVKPGEVLFRPAGTPLPARRRQGAGPGDRGGAEVGPA